MSEASPRPKATPRRHRPRQNGRGAGQKAYASENDIGSFEAGHYRTPDTPNKALFQSPAPGSQSSTQTSSKQRSRNRVWEGEAATSSPDVQQDKSTPTARRASTRSNNIPMAAFAGATFHASPAPSALPIPSFLSKSSNELSAGSIHNGHQISPSATDSDTAVPYSSSAPRPNESPLDFMFRAHRQEKERQFGSPEYDGQDSPSHLSRRAGHSPQPFAPHKAPTSTRHNNGGIDRTELDGTPGLDIGPAFSTPYHERIRAARASRADSAPTQQSKDTSTAGNTSTDDATVALKKFLFGGGQQAARSPLSTSCAQAPATSYPQVTGGQADNTDSRQGNNIQAMENDLRRILKLDSSSS